MRAIVDAMGDASLFIESHGVPSTTVDRVGGGEALMQGYKTEDGVEAMLAAVATRLGVALEDVQHLDAVCEHALRICLVSGAPLPAFIWGQILLALVAGHSLGRKQALAEVNRNAMNEEGSGIVRCVLCDAEAPREAFTHDERCLLA